MSKLKRVFLYKEQELPEVSGSPKANLTHYATLYPELVNAQITGPEIKDGKAIYEFKPKTATKG